MKRTLVIIGALIGTGLGALWAIRVWNGRAAVKAYRAGKQAGIKQTVRAFHEAEANQ